MAVLPLLRRRGFDPTCLVIGAMAPDFEYFARMKQTSSISHTWLGIALWNIPVTLVLALAFHRLVKWPVVLVAPRFVARRAAVFASRPWAEPWTLAFVASCVVSAALGATTHLVWDGITHSDGFIAARIPALHVPISLPLWGDMIAHRVIQHASTVVGLIVLAIVAIRALRRVDPIELGDPGRTWPRLVALSCVGSGLALSYVRVMHRHWYDLGSMVVVVISGALFGALLASVALQRVASRLQTP